MAKKKRENKDNPDKDLLSRIRTRFKIMVDADQDNRRKAMEDLRFVSVPGEQWDANMKKERGDRPCYEFNKLRVTIKRVINDMRSNRPAGKVRAVEDGDKGTADIYEGLIRNIWNASDGDTVIDYAAEYQVGGGMGAWRINTKYVADDVFDLDIVVEPITNPFCLYADPAAKDILKRDADDWILTDRISRKAYEERWPDANVIDWDGDDFDDTDEWQDEETVRICEYWYKEQYDKELWQLVDGSVVEAGEGIDPTQVRRKRIARCDRIKMCIASGDAILEKPVDWAGSMHPFVQVYGEYVVIDGRLYWYGLTRFGKDAQKSYNVARTAIAETIAQAPQAKWWATADQALGHTEKWAEAHQKNFPFLLYNADAKTGGRAPERMGGAEVPIALIQESQLASEEIKAVTGIYDASLGNKSNEQTGKAIIARQQQGEIATFNYADNMGKAIRRTWELLIDLVPKIYDTERQLRILGTDGAEDYATVNQRVVDPASGEAKTVNDLTHGRYDVAVTVGPSWATKRMEAAEVYMNMGQAFPPLMQFAGDLIMKSMDLPYSEDIAERIQAMLPPPIQELLQQGKKIPPEAQAVMAQAAQAMQVVQQQTQLVQAAAQEVEQNKAESEKAQAQAKQAVAEIGVKKAEFEAFVQKQLAMLAQKELALMQRELQAENAGERQAIEGEKQALQFESGNTVKQIQQAAEQFTKMAEQAAQQIESKGSELSQRVDQTIAALMNNGTGA